MNLVKKIQSNLSKFLPRGSALRKRYGHAANGAGFQPHTRVLVTDDEGGKHPAIVVENLGGDCVRVELLDNGEILDVVTSSLRRAPKRRRPAAAEIAPEGYAVPEPPDVA